jgi:hypothetical protein
MAPRKPQKLRKKQAEAAQEPSPRMFIGTGLQPYGYSGQHPRKQPQPKPVKR